MWYLLHNYIPGCQAATEACYHRCLIYDFFFFEQGENTITFLNYIDQKSKYCGCNSVRTDYIMSASFSFLQQWNYSDLPTAFAAAIRSDILKCHGGFHEQFFFLGLNDPLDFRWKAEKQSKVNDKQLIHKFLRPTSFLLNLHICIVKAVIAGRENKYIFYLWP